MGIPRTLIVVFAGVALALALGVFWSSPGPAAATATKGIATGSFHSCSITAIDRVKCWGSNSMGQLGDGTTQNRSSAVDVVGLGGVEAIAAGQSHTCAIMSAGEVECWGSNASGQLGATSSDTCGSTACSKTPVTVQGIGIGSGNYAVRLALGMSHSCAITVDLEPPISRVKCWGQGTGGQLGNGGTSNSTVPVDVSGLTGVDEIASGWKHSCALTTEGAVKCWGWNSFGQLGDGLACGTGACATPQDVSGLGSGVRAIAAGGLNIVGFACAVLESDGSVQCWGDNRDGQLGDGTTAQHTTPTAVCQVYSGGQCTQALTGIESISAGGDIFHGHTCAVVESTQTAKCWGDNGAGQLGDGGYCSQQGGQYACLTPVEVCGKGYTPPCDTSDDLLQDVVAISTGGLHTCALTSAGGMGCWGNDGQGQVGDNNPSTTVLLQPVDIVGLWRDANMIDAGGHTCAVTTSNALQCWGPNDQGQLGSTTSSCGSVNCSFIPLTVAGLSNVTAVSAGDAHTCAIAGGAAKCWGDNSSGQLGNGNTIDGTPPVQVSGLTANVIAISSGGKHSCAIVDPPSGNNVLKCWGDDSYGQLGNNTPKQNSSLPVNVSMPFGDPIVVAAGGRHACAILSGTVYCWGDDRSGQLGLGGRVPCASTECLVPQYIVANEFDVDNDPDYNGNTPIYLTAGDAHTCALADISNAQMFCWGSNSDGQLGLGSTNDHLSLPTELYLGGPGYGDRVNSPSAGGWHTCAVYHATVYCAGRNSSGQLGDGGTTPRNVMTQSPSISKAGQVAAGLEHTCVRIDDQDYATKGLKCWGKNDLGQAGDGSPGNRLNPSNVYEFTPKPLPCMGGGAGVMGDTLLMLAPMLGLVLAGAGWKRRRWRDYLHITLWRRARGRPGKEA